MTTSTVETALIQTVERLWEKQSLTQLKQFLGTLHTEDEFNELIQQAYENHMAQYADFLKRQAHKKINSLQTTLWQAGVEANYGRFFKAEELIVNRVFVESLDGPIPHELQVQATQILARIYGALMRYEEVEEQHRLLEKLDSLTPLYKAHYLMDKIDREEAIALIESLAEEERAQKQHRLDLMLADLYLQEGQPEKSLDYLTALVEQNPDSFVLRAERVSPLYLAGQLEQALEELRLVNANNPYHHLKHSFVTIEAHILYKLDRLEELVSHVKTYPDYFKGHPYKEVTADAEGKRVLLNLKQPIQKVNYCVPASLAVILQAFGQNEEQEVIARAVKEDQGTQLHHAREYMESIGYESLFFKGTVELYKKLLDAGVPVMLSTLVEMNAHVQVVVGYDDRLKTLKIQDPNEVHPFNLRYDRLKTAYQLRDNLSLVFFPKDKAFIRDWIDLEEHETLAELHSNTAEDEATCTHVVTYFEKHPTDVAAAVIGILSHSNDVPDEISEKWLALVEERFGAEHVDVKLLKGHYYYWKDEFDKALEMLQFKGLGNNSNALFMKAVSHLRLGELSYAENALHKSIESSPYQPIAYSYLARIHMQLGSGMRAYRWTDVAMRMAPKDVFVRVTEALVYFDNGAYEEAYTRFESMAKEDDKDAYAVYEMARTRQFQERTEEAEALYRKSLEMDQNEPFAYLRMAELYSDDTDRSRNVLREGIENLSKAVPLYTMLAELETEQGNYAVALDLYRKASELQSDDVDIQMSIARILVLQKDTAAAVAVVEASLAKEDRSGLFEIAQYVHQNLGDLEIKRRVMCRLEQLMEQATGDELEDLAIHYIDFSNEPALFARTLDTFVAIRSRETTPELLGLEGQLHEQMGTRDVAKALYEQAGNHVALNQLAKMVDFAEENDDELLARLKRLLLVMPHHEEGLQNLIQLFMVREDYEAVLQVGYFGYHYSYQLLRHDAIVIAAFEENKLDELSQFIDSLKHKVNPEWWYVVKAAIAHAADDVEAAEVLLGKARNEPGAYASQFEYIQFLFVTGRAKLALKYIRGLMKKHPENPDYAEHFVEALKQSNKMMFLEAYMRRFPRAQLNQHLEHVAKELGEEILAFMEEDQTGLAALKQKAKLIFYSGYAFAFYDTALKRDPKNVALALQIGEFHMNMNLPDEAETVLLPYANGENLDVERMLTFAYSEKIKDKAKPKDIATFEKRIEWLIEHTPDDLPLYDIWAEYLAGNEDYKGAIEVLERGLEVNPYYVEFYSMIWKSLQFWHEEKSGPHLKAFTDRMPALVLEHEDFRIERAVAFVDLGDTDAAIALLDSFGPDSNQYDASRFERARVEVLLGNKNAARKLLRSVLAKDHDGMFEALAEEDELLVGLL
ncbi:hypothetical protein CQS04_07350 [Chryseomicrobium excrementi]|uniref:Peptidase C39-like domain-containing protein n=1 Tax=Chryseomicrobium excrementi TaxID=2041346 RepID=A0A2M9F0H5_9BACL|nr:tetratricopeptide repeat protein [Chryseomicrobium excrementi]PJK16962.1 hypothetical protein CQS04_07350 [Chryseomicrobium excrementi]